MRKLLKALFLAAAILTVLTTVPALAFDRGQANAKAVSEARILTATQPGGAWRAQWVVITDLLGPQAGTVQWVAHFNVERTGHGTEICIGGMEIGPEGQIYHPTVECGPAVLDG